MLYDGHIVKTDHVRSFHQPHVETLEKLKDNPEPASSLDEAFRRKANPTEFREILVDAGADPESAEALIAEYQREHGMVISDEDVDVETLRAVASGGGKDCVQAHDCDKDPTLLFGRTISSEPQSGHEPLS